MALDYVFDASDNFKKNLRFRVLLLLGFVLAGFFIIFVRLWYLQVAQARQLKAQAENNRLRQITFPGMRGDIYDRFGVKLVGSRPSFNIVLIREDISDLNDVLSKLEKLVKVNAEKTLEKITAVPPFVPVIISYDISREDAAILEEHRYELPGISIAIRPIRNYRYGSFAAHLIGYLGEISREQMQDPVLDEYKSGDIIGKYGIEKSFEPILRGARGKKLLEVDATGRELKVISREDSGVGKDLYLSLDYETQLKAERLMEEKRGAIVAMKPDTGEILAIVSSPAFDLNKFAYGVEPNYWKELLADKYHPLNNRAIMGLYAPASTYKIIIATAALEESVIDPEQKLLCAGYFKLGKKWYRCWNREGHGNVNLLGAITQSCDIYFYQVGMKLGVNKISQWARKFGLNSITGIALEDERSGLVPTKAWKEKYRGAPWILGETMSIAIGQGYTLVTPLQMAVVTSSIANGGHVVQPKLVYVKNNDETELETLGRRNIGVKPETLEFVREGLLKVVNSRYGTGKHAKIWGVQVAGKTGTGQVVKKRNEDIREHDEMPEKLRDHAWFVGYAPYENPEIVVSVVIEHGGSGGVVAAPIAKTVIETYLKSLKRNRIETGEEF